MYGEGIKASDMAQEYGITEDKAERFLMGQCGLLTISKLNSKLGACVSRFSIVIDEPHRKHHEEDLNQDLFKGRPSDVIIREIVTELDMIDLYVSEWNCSNYLHKHRDLYTSIDKWHNKVPLNPLEIIKNIGTIFIPNKEFRTKLNEYTALLKGTEHRYIVTFQPEPYGYGSPYSRDVSECLMMFPKTMDYRKALNLIHIYN